MRSQCTYPACRLRYVECIDLGHGVHTVQLCIGKIVVENLIKGQKISGCKQLSILTSRFIKESRRHSYSAIFNLQEKLGWFNPTRVNNKCLYFCRLHLTMQLKLGFRNATSPFSHIGRKPSKMELIHWAKSDQYRELTVNFKPIMQPLNPK